MRQVARARFVCDSGRLRLPARRARGSSGARACGECFGTPASGRRAGAVSRTGWLAGYPPIVIAKRCSVGVFGAASGLMFGSCTLRTSLSSNGTSTK
jgi:hypothetical protein